MLFKHPTPNVTILEKNIFYDSKIDLTPIFILKNRNSKKYCFYCFYGQNRVFFTNCREWNVDRSLWQSVNASLSSYVPSFRHAISLRPDHATIFPRCCHVFEKKSESNRAALFLRVVKRKKREIVLTRIELKNMPLATKGLIISRTSLRKESFGIWRRRR